MNSTNRKYLIWLVSLAFCVFSQVALAQSTNQFVYSGIARDSAGDLFSNKTISIQLAILDRDSLVEFSETHLTNTDDFGVFLVVVGDGTTSVGHIDSIMWLRDKYLLRIEADFNGGSNFKHINTSFIYSSPLSNSAVRSVYADTANYLRNFSTSLRELLENDNDADSNSLLNINSLSIGSSQVDSSAALEITSTTKGFLPPRLTQNQRDVINNPATGLVIYCTDCISGGEIQYFNGTTWKSNNLTGNNEVPYVRSGAAQIIGSNKVKLLGTVVSDGGLNIIRRGFIKSVNASFSNADTIIVSGALGNFSSDSISLSSNTAYYFKAFAENYKGLGFGYISSFFLPDSNQNQNSSTVTLDSITNITTQSASFHANIISSNGTIVERGFVVDTLPQPTLANIKIDGGQMLGYYNEVLNGLSSGNNEYYVRAYLISSNDTTYSNQSSFNTEISSGALTLGQSFQGGIVFYISPDGQSGLVVTPSNIGNATFACTGSSVGPTSKGIWSGASNTTQILSSCNSPSNAAELCANLVYQGYDDWYLPSWDELIAMRENLHANGLGGFSGWVWSSTEYDDNRALAYDWSCGSSIEKTSNAGVRAIRAFSLGNSSVSSPTISINATSNNSFYSTSVSTSITNVVTGRVYEIGIAYSDSNSIPTINDNISVFENIHAPFACHPSLPSTDNSTILGHLNSLNSNTQYSIRAYAKT
ncbi:DUF1566 domain-containing protein, partial [Schleiferiaceae bacterium]|nr:DUF1566 domain-containing protein [Schleiferiaceae bacterium]